MTELHPVIWPAQKRKFFRQPDKKYGNGASKFIGEALKFYCQNMINANNY